MLLDFVSSIPALVVLVYFIYYGATHDQANDRFITILVILLAISILIARPILRRLFSHEIEENRKRKLSDVKLSEMIRAAINTIMEAKGSTESGLDGEEYILFEDDCITIIGTPAPVEPGTPYKWGIEYYYSIYEKNNTPATPGSIFEGHSWLLYTEVNRTPFVRRGREGELGPWFDHLINLSKEIEEKLEEERLEQRDKASREAIKKAKEAKEKMERSKLKRKIIDATDVITSWIGNEDFESDITTLRRPYKDDKIHIKPTKSILVISIHIDTNSWRPVYEVRWDKNDHPEEIIFRDGRWTEYILDVLYPRAVAKKSEVELEERKKEQAKFVPICDGFVFKDVLPEPENPPVNYEISKLAMPIDE